MSGGMDRLRQESLPRKTEGYLIAVISHIENAVRMEAWKATRRVILSVQSKSGPDGASDGSRSHQSSVPCYGRDNSSTLKFEGMHSSFDRLREAATGCCEGIMSKATPGPWAIEPTTKIDGTTKRFWVKIKGGKSKGKPIGIVRLEADANLIAAAPDMLEALGTALSAMMLHQWGILPEDSPERQTADRIQAIIAKAEGR